MMDVDVFEFGFRWAIFVDLLTSTKYRRKTHIITVIHVALWVMNSDGKRDEISSRRLWKNVGYSCPRNTKKYWYWIHCPNGSKYTINACLDFETRRTVSSRLLLLVINEVMYCPQRYTSNITPAYPPQVPGFWVGLWPLTPPTLVTLVCDQKPQLFCTASKAPRKCCTCFRMFTLHVDLLCFFNLRGSVTRHFFHQGGSHKLPFFLKCITLALHNAHKN